MTQTGKKMNKKRQAIWDKSKGHCWYCGCELGDKGWHADHFEPVFRNNSLNDGMWKPERDNQSNLVPACSTCNLFKAAFSLEDFRSELQKQASRAIEYSKNFRMALKYGQVEIKESEIKFWFEENIK